MKLNIPRSSLAARSAIRVARRVFGRCVKSSEQFRAAVDGKRGLEIGGPSGAFGDTGILPLYRYVGGLDNCDYAVETVWEGKRSEGMTFSFHPDKPHGSNLIREATELTGIDDHRYDFVLSCHSLEHTSNPLKALGEWRRVLAPGGAMVVILPDHRYTFDHLRKSTPIAHLLQDYDQGTEETDLTHLPEILELHDLARDPLAGSREQFHQRSLQNFKNRCLHHHVFDEHNSRELLEAAGLSVEILECVKPFHIALLARCRSTGRDPSERQRKNSADGVRG